MMSVAHFNVSIYLLQGVVAHVWGRRKVWIQGYSRLVYFRQAWATEWDPISNNNKTNKTKQTTKPNKMQQQQQKTVFAIEHLSLSGQNGCVYGEEHCLFSYSLKAWGRLWKIFKGLLLLFIMYMCLCTCLCGGLCIVVHVLRSQGMGSLGIGGLGGCKPLTVGTGNWTLVFCNHWVISPAPKSAFAHQPLAMLVGHTSCSSGSPGSWRANTGFPLQVKEKSTASRVMLGFQFLHFQWST